MNQDKTIKKTIKDDKKTQKLQEIISRRRFVKSTPDKLRIMSCLIKGKKLSDALAVLRFSQKSASRHLIATLKQAAAQAKDKDMSADDLIISIVKIDEGPKLKRRRILHQGRSTSILKRMSHITIVLAANGNSKHAFRHAARNTKQKETKK